MRHGAASGFGDGSMRLGAPPGPVPAGLRSDAGGGRAGGRGGSRGLGYASASGVRAADGQSDTAAPPTALQSPAAVGRTRKGQGRGDPRLPGGRECPHPPRSPPLPHPLLPTPHQAPCEGRWSLFALPASGLGPGICKGKALGPVLRHRWSKWTPEDGKALLWWSSKRGLHRGNIQRVLSRITRALCPPPAFSLLPYRGERSGFFPGFFHSSVPTEAALPVGHSG